MPSFQLFGDMLSYLRQQEQLTQRELARAVGYSDAHINRLEKGLRLPDPTVIAARFIEALHLKDKPELSAKLIELAVQANSPKPATSSQTVDSPIEFAKGIVSPPRKQNLPVQIASFVGRGEDIQALLAQLGAHRLVTLTGPGGVGKTRLALEVGDQISANGGFIDGVWWIELAKLSDPSAIVQMMLRCLGLTEIVGSSHLGQIQMFLNRRNVLLILDNCEHLIAACAELADTLLRACPLLSILATSREGLNVTGEILWPVKSLPMGSAIRLFGERAHAVQPLYGADKIELVERICRRLDGLPLAIELAASRLRGMSLEQIAARLDDRFHLLTGGSRTALTRHQTLRATLDWSYHLLSASEQLLFRHLAIFADGCTNADVEAVYVTSELGINPTFAVEEGLAQLVQRSLLQFDPQEAPPRYRLLETLREFGLEKLRIHDELEPLQRRFAHWALRLAETAYEHQNSEYRHVALRQLDSEYENIRAVLQWAAALTEDDLDILMFGQIVATLAWYWQVRVYANEGVRWLKLVLKSIDHLPTQLYGRLLFWQANFEDNQLGLQADLARQVDEAIVIMKRVNDTTFLARAQLYRIALEWRMKGAGIVSEAGILEAIDLALRYGDKASASRGFSMLAEINREHQLYSDAIRYYEEARALAIQSFNSSREAQSLVGLAETMGAQLELDESEHYANAALQLSRAANYIDHGLQALRQLGDIKRFQGDYAQAKSFITEMYQLSVKWHLAGFTTVATMMQGLIARDQNDLPSAITLLKESIGLNQEFGERVEPWLQTSILGLASVEVLQEEWKRAAHLFGAVSQWIGEGFYKDLHNHFQFWSYLVYARAKMGDLAFNTAYDSGRQMTRKQVMQFALSNSDQPWLASRL